MSEKNTSMIKSDIRKYAFKQTLPLGFEIVTVSRLYNQNKKIITRPHRTDFFHVIWVQHGNPVHHINFNPVKLIQDSFLFVSKDCVQFFDVSEEWEGKIILFTEDFFCRSIIDSNWLNSTILFNDLYSTSPIPINKCISQFTSIFQQMEAELTNKNDKHQPLILKNLLNNLLMLSEREVREQGFCEIKPSPELDNLIQFKKLLENNFKINKSVSKYSSALNISEKILNKATSQILNKTPKELIDDRVILEAKLLLAYNISSIKEISFSLGFEELTNFIKYFKKHTNLTPAEYRESLP